MNESEVINIVNKDIRVHNVVLLLHARGKTVSKQSNGLVSTNTNRYCTFISNRFLFSISK